MMTQSLSARITLENIVDLVYSLYSLYFALRGFHLFHSLQIVLNDKNFPQKNQAKMFAENFFNSKPAEFYLM